MVKEKFSHIFKQPYKKLEATWDATVIDMIRCKHIIKAYDTYKVLDNVKEMSPLLLDGLNSISKFKNVRGSGFLIGFDLETENERDALIEEAYRNGLLVNAAGKNTIRLRPNLNLYYNEVDEALMILEKSL